MTPESTLSRERSFHNSLHREYPDRRQLVDNLQSDLIDAAVQLTNAKLALVCPEQTVLDLGCGPGWHAIRCARKFGAREVYGVDLSDAAIESARRRAMESHLSNVHFEVMNAEELTFPDHTFDVVCGFAIIHHLNVSKALAEVTRVLKPEGTAVFLEPLGENVAVNLFRRMTPRLRTPDEHPLLTRDLETFKTYFASVDLQYLNLTSLASVLIPPILGRRQAMAGLARFDNWLFRACPTLGRYAWNVVLTLQTPLVKPSVAAS